MATETQPAGTVKVTITKSITRATARKTIERLFLTCKSVSGPIDVRSANFKDQPKRRGGCIWTKRPNKLHPELVRGVTANVRATPQTFRDLSSVAEFVEYAK